MVRRIAVLTGDNDAPGINGVVRAVTRTALGMGWEVMGVCDGYTGLIDSEFMPLTARTVDEMNPCESTMLGSTGGKRFLMEAEQSRVLEQLAAHDIDALIVVGGDKTQAGAEVLSRLGFPVNGVAASIENDLVGFDMTIGVDTAMNVALDSIDQLRLTRPENGTAFIVEVAGRKSGYLALMSGIACNADMIVIPEVEPTLEQLAGVIDTAYEAGKSHPIIVIAEGANCSVDRVKRYFETDASPRQKVQVARLGYLQRRAAPNAWDRLLGTRLGTCAVDALARGEYGVLAGWYQGVTRVLPFVDVVGKANELDAGLIHLANNLSFSNFVEAQAP